MMVVIHGQKYRSESEVIWYLREQDIPEHLCDGLMRYLLHRIKPGGFLSAVLQNDLIGAFQHGDHQSIAGLAPLVRFIANKAPIGCYGSEGQFERWLEARDIE